MNELCKYVPKWSTLFATSGKEFVSELKTAITRLDAAIGAQAFLRLAKAPKITTETGQTSYPWSDNNALQAFRNQVAQQQFSPVQFVVDRTNLPPSMFHAASSAVPSNKPYLRNYQVAATSQSLTMSGIGVSENFQMKFTAKKMQAIRVHPGEWFDRSILSQPQLKYLFGETGTMPLLPMTIWVAYQPSVFLKLTELEISVLQQAWNNQQTVAIAAGAALFKNAPHINWLRNHLMQDFDEPIAAMLSQYNTTQEESDKLIIHRPTLDHDNEAFLADSSAMPHFEQVSYSVHLESTSWSNYVTYGVIAGTTGQSRRMEAIKIKLVDAPPNVHVVYRAHVAGHGWLGWMRDDQVAGTTGESRRMEAIQIYLENAPDTSIHYRVHAEGVGWMPWTCCGNVAGTTGQSRRIEAIQVYCKTNVITAELASSSATPQVIAVTSEIL